MWPGLLPVPGLPMRPPRGEVAEGLLMEAEHGLPTGLHEQRELRRGAQAPGDSPDIARAQVRMELAPLRESRRAQGGRHPVEDQPGPCLTQGQEVRTERRRGTIHPSSRRSSGKTPGGWDSMAHPNEQET